MKAWWAAIIAGALLVPAAGASLARSNPNPVTIRGIALHIRTGGFDLRTSARGTLHVVTQRATTIVETGKSGSLSVHANDHVGVRGFLRGNVLRAISVRIYPVKPKPVTYRGIIVAVHGNAVTLAVGLARVTVVLGGRTDIATTNGHTVTRLSVGQRVSVRAQWDGTHLNALTVRVYVTKSHRPTRRRTTHTPKPKSVTVRGQVIALTAGSVTVRSAGRTTVIRRTAATVLAGAGGPLRVGSRVSVRACCLGHPLVATRVDVLKGKRPATVLITGTLVSLSTSTIIVQTARGRIASRRTARTRVDGPAPLPGARVSLRYYRDSSGAVATRLHIYPPPPVRSLRGTVVSVTGTLLTITARGRRYTVRPTHGASITLGGHSVPLTSLHPGDRVTVSGQVVGGVVVAVRVAAAVSLPRTSTLRGVITAVGAGSITLRESTGNSIRLRLTAGVPITLAGKAVPLNWLFPGATARVRVMRVGGTVTASAVAVTAIAHSASGRITSVTPSTLRLTDRSGVQILLHVPAGVRPTDDGKVLALTALHMGAYLSAHGYREPDASLLATVLTVTHPRVEVAGTVLSAGHILVIETRDGTRVSVRLPAGTPISTGSAHVPLTPATIPVGISVRVHGTVSSDGTVVASMVTVHLRAWTVRAPATSVGSAALTLTLSTGEITVTLEEGAVVEQGARVIKLSDIVPGDDLTVYGYVFGPKTLLARKIDVHRLRVTVTGTITSLETGGFTLDGRSRVILLPDTALQTATSPTVGMMVKVRGYRRGDGAILALSVRSVKAVQVDDALDSSLRREYISNWMWSGSRKVMSQPVTPSLRGECSTPRSSKCWAHASSAARSSTVRATWSRPVWNSLNGSPSVA